MGLWNTRGDSESVWSLKKLVRKRFFPLVYFNKLSEIVMQIRLALALLAALILSGNAQAQSNTRCQCSYDNWLGDCKARVELEGKWFKVMSDEQQCSRVDWYIDGNPQVTIVTDGAEMEEWLGGSESPELAIQSCKVCKDSQYSRSDIGTNNGTCEKEYVDRDGDGGKYRGQCKDGMPHGEGRVDYYNGDTYSGLFGNGQKNGQGTYQWKSTGVRYQGEWLNDERNGQGTTIWPNGYKFIGVVRNDVEWNGDLYRNDGTVCEVISGLQEPSTCYQQ